MAADLIGDIPDITDAIARLRGRGEPEATWLGWLWAQSRAKRRGECLTRIGSGRAKLPLSELGLATQVFTPAPIAQWMARHALEDAPDDPLVYDPCVGTGNLLVAIVMSAASSGRRTLRLSGYDLDSHVLQVAHHCIMTAAELHGVEVDLSLRSPTGDDPEEALLGSLVWAPNTAPDAVIANPPWLYQRNMSPALREALKRRQPVAARDLYAAFLDRCTELVAHGGTCTLVSPRSFLAVRQYAGLRARLESKTRLTHLVDLGPGRFPNLTGEKSACALSVWRGGQTGSTRFVDLSGQPWSELPARPVAIQSVGDFRPVQGEPWAFGVADELLACFRRHPALQSRIEITGSQNITADNARFVRFHWEVEGIYTDTGTPPTRRPHWRPYAKGGTLQRYAGNLERVVDWSEDARAHYASARTANLLKERHWYRAGITYTDLSTRGFHARRLPPGCVFDKAGPSLFCRDPDEELLILGLLNTPLAQALLRVLNSTLHTQVADVRALPVPGRTPATVQDEFSKLVAQVTAIVEQELQHSETSPTFAQPWLDPDPKEDLESRWDRTCTRWNRQAQRAHEAHLRLGAITCEWFGIDPKLELPNQPPPVTQAPTLREAARQWVGVHVVEAAFAALPGATLNLNALRRQFTRKVNLQQLEAALGESIRDHVFGGGFWKRHVRVHQKSPRVWLLPGRPPRVLPFVRLADHDVIVPSELGSRGAWRATFGDDPS